MKEKMKNPQGLKVLVAGSILQLFLGVIYVWSMFVKPVSEFFVWQEEKVRLTSSFMLCCFVLGILIGGKIQAKIGTQKVVLAGGLLMAAGMLCSSFVPMSAPWIIYISYGIVGGFGVGMAYNAIITSAQKWFPKKRGLATGISVFMFGFSTVIFAPLIVWLVGSFGIIAAFRILASAFAIATLGLFWLVKLPAEESAVAVDLSGQRQFSTGEMLKTKQFYFIALSMMMLTASFFILNPLFKDLGEARGLEDNITTILVQITGIANAFGRLATPVLGDRIGREKAVFTILALTAVATGILSFATGGLFVVMVAIIAFCYGGSSGIYPLVTSQYFGLKHIGSNYGMVMVGFMLSSLLFPFLTGLITNETVKFITLAIIAAVGCALILLLSATKKNAAVKEK